jgi:hypothetical protein
MRASNPIETLSQCMAHAVYEGFPEFEYQDRDWSQGFQPGVEATYITKKRKHTAYDVVVYAMFPQTWGSTALGFGGLGGQAITDAYTVVLHSHQGGGYCVYFGGRFAYRIVRPCDKFWDDIRTQSLNGVAGSKEIYESGVEK